MSLFGWANGGQRVVPAGSTSCSSLLHALEAFYREHRRCGELDGGVQDDRVWAYFRNLVGRHW
jgi:hypothetical protein